MLNEKPSDDFHWKNKLADLENIPGDAFNKEAAWGKLHERMQGVRRNKTAIWYWAAAACLLLTLLIPWLFLTGKKEAISVKNNSVHKQTQSTPSRVLTGSTKEIPAVTSSLLSEKKSSPASVEKGNQINPLLKRDIMRLKYVHDTKEKEEFVTQKITINTAVPIDTIISIVAIMPGKKKLTVVHINELGDPVEESPNIARSPEHRSLVKFINQQVSTSLPSSGNTGFNIFKTKNVPSN